MPLYVFRCDDCGGELEESLPVSEASASFPCECGGQLERIITPVATIGVTWSKPLALPSIGKTFETNRQYRDYAAQQAAQGVVAVEGNDGAWRKMKDRAREGADKVAQSMGWKDHEHRGQERKKEKAKRLLMDGKKNITGAR